MSRTHHPRGRWRPGPGKADTKAEARVERRTAEAVGLRRLLEDPEGDAVLPTEQRHAGDVWRWT